MIGKPTRGTTPDVSKLIELYQQGYSMLAIGKTLGHHHSVISYHLYKNNIPIRKDHLRNPQIKTEDIIRLYDEGNSTCMLAKQFGLTEQAIYGRLIKANHKLRSFKEAIHLAHKLKRIVVPSGEKSTLWKGGKYIDKKGYIIIRIHCKYIRENRYVWEQTHGKLPNGWIVHHLNGIRTDDRLDNLFALPRKRHSPNEIIKPHQQRIRQLEQELEQCKITLQTNMLMGVNS